MLPEQEESEMRIAIFERSLVGPQLAYEMKMKNLDASGLIMIGVECSAKMERERDRVQMVMQEEAAKLQVQAVAQQAGHQKMQEGFGANNTNQRQDNRSYQNHAKPSNACRSCEKQHAGRP